MTDQTHSTDLFTQLNAIFDKHHDNIVEMDTRLSEAAAEIEADSANTDSPEYASDWLEKQEARSLAQAALSFILKNHPEAVPGILHDALVFAEEIGIETIDELYAEDDTDDSGE